MDFAYPKILYGLLIIPVIIGLWLLANTARRRKLRRFGRPDELQHLMPMASPYKPVIKLVLMCVAVGALVIALARPRGGAREASEERSGIEVMIAFDVSRSMLASSTDDPQGVSRLNRAKFLLNRLIDKLDNDKVGLIVFAGQAYTQLPLTGDFLSAKMYLDELTPDMVATQGTDIGGAINMALNNFTGDKDVSKAIILITDCEDNEAAGVEMAREAKKRDVQVDVIGVGTPKGAPIPINAAKGEFLKDYDGVPVTTKFDAQAAKEIAAAGGGIYVNGSSSDAVNEIDDYLDKLSKSDLGSVRYKASAEKFPIYIWIALAALFIDFFVLDRKIGWLSKINFFSRPQK